MENFIKAIQTSIEGKNWYSVLFISLTLPDICGKIDTPSSNSSKTRTIEWCDKYLTPLYTVRLGIAREEHILLGGADFYALRCAYLHEGSDDVTTQKARQHIDKFRFIQPLTDGLCIHNNKNHNTLQLQVDEFGKDIIKAVLNWLDDIKDDPAKKAEVDSLLNIEMIDISKGFSV
ncbi:TPA: hypothetical protein R6351_005327 [Klebsiella pneumoniae]|nr:hypothetical protein [Klebsiella pneumoniae]